MANNEGRKRGPAPDTLKITLPPAEALKRLLKPTPKAEPKPKRARGVMHTNGVPPACRRMRRWAILIAPLTA